MNFNLNDIKQHFIFQARIQNKDEYNFGFSSSNNLVVRRNNESECDTYNIDERGKSYSFMLIGGGNIFKTYFPDAPFSTSNDIVNITKRYRLLSKDLNKILKRNIPLNWPFVKYDPFIVDIHNEGQHITFDVSIVEDVFSFRIKLNELSAKTRKSPNEFELLSAFYNTLNLFLKSERPESFKSKIKKIYNENIDFKGIYGENIELFTDFIQSSTKISRVAAIGKYRNMRMEYYYKQIFNPSLTSEFNNDKMCASIENEFIKIVFDLNTYEVLNIIKNKEGINKNKNYLQSIYPFLSYYKLATIFFDNISNSCDRIKDVKDVDSDEKVLSGVCYKDSIIDCLYSGISFPVKVSIPHIDEFFVDNIKLSQEKATKEFNKLSLYIDKTISNISNDLPTFCKENYSIFQSPSAKIICDFLKSEENASSFTRIYNFLCNGDENNFKVKEGSLKFSQCLSGYTKEKIKEKILNLTASGLIKYKTVEGAYGPFKVYSFNTDFNFLYNVYFNDDTSQNCQSM